MNAIDVIQSKSRVACLEGRYRGGDKRGGERSRRVIFIEEYLELIVVGVPVELAGDRRLVPVDDVVEVSAPNRQAVVGTGRNVCEHMNSNAFIFALLELLREPVELFCKTNEIITRSLVALLGGIFIFSRARLIRQARSFLCEERRKSNAALPTESRPADSAKQQRQNTQKFQCKGLRRCSPCPQEADKRAGKQASDESLIAFKEQFFFPRNGLQLVQARIYS